jgi:hypothetical protein
VRQIRKGGEQNAERRPNRVLGNEEERRLYEFLCQRSSESDALGIHGVDESFAFQQTLR